MVPITPIITQIMLPIITLLNSISAPIITKKLIPIIEARYTQKEGPEPIHPRLQSISIVKPNNMPKNPPLKLKIILTFLTPLFVVNPFNFAQDPLDCVSRL